MMIKTKVCSKCGKRKPLSAFYKRKDRKIGVRSACKECEYKYYGSKQRAYNRKYARTPRGIYTSITRRLYPSPREKMKMSRDEFVAWYNSQEKKCYYCGIDEKDLPKVIKDPKFNQRLTVDRKDSSKWYEKDNMVLSCWTCNRIKNNFFTAEEMKEIAKRYVAPRVQKILSNTDDPLKL